MTIVGIIEDHVRELLGGEHTGHDWYHTDRVRKLALTIARSERADREIVELAALLHDVEDYKFSGDEFAGYRHAKELLESHAYDAARAEHVASIVRDLSFKGVGVDDSMATLEGACVQDADRLDAIGAIGIARAFAYGGHKDRMIYDPEEEPETHDSPEAYRNNTSSTITHFYEKLLHLKDRFKTATGRRLAEARDAYMRAYLDEFLAEWDGKR